VDHPQRIHREFFDPIDLPDLMPEEFFLQRILADDDVANAAFNEIERDWSAWRRAPALEPFVCEDPQPGGRGRVSASRHALAPDELVSDRLLDDIRPHVGDLHFGSSGLACRRIDAGAADLASN